MPYLQVHKTFSGMTHELQQHLVDQSPPIDPITGVPIIDLENFCCGESFQSLSPKIFETS